MYSSLIIELNRRGQEVKPEENKQRENNRENIFMILRVGKVFLNGKQKGLNTKKERDNIN